MVMKDILYKDCFIVPLQKKDIASAAEIEFPCRKVGKRDMQEFL